MVIEKIFPFLSDLKGYSLKDARADLVAAVTVAIVASPQSMAYAVIAGVPPVYGLYASMLPVMVAALWGSSRYLLAGPTNAISMILYSTMSQLTVAGVAVATLPEGARLGYLFALTLLAGLIQLAMGLARLGDLANFISHAVIVAFTVGASLLIALGQIKNLLGLQFQAPADTWAMVQMTWEHAPEVNIYALGLGLFTMAVALVMKKFKPRWPAALLALVAAGAVAGLGNAASHGVIMAGAVPPGLPPLSLPDLGLAQWNSLFLPALAVALLGAVESLAIARTLASQRGETLDGSQELIGQGLGNVAAGLSSGIAGCGSFARSAVNFASGARTRFAAAFSGLLTLAALLLLGPLVQYIPLSALAALLLVICWNMLNVAEIRFTLRTTRGDALVWCVTVAAVLVLDLEKAVFLGVLLSLAWFLHRESHPRVEPLSRAMLPSPGDAWLLDCPYVTLFRLEGSLFFGAVAELERALHAHARQRHKVIILHMNRVNFLDATGAHALRGFLRRCGQAGTTVIVCWSNPEVKATLVRAGLTRGRYGCWLAGNLSGAIVLAATLLREHSACAACCGCDHGKAVLEAVDSHECLPPTEPEAEDIPTEQDTLPPSLDQDRP